MHLSESSEAKRTFSLSFVGRLHDLSLSPRSQLSPGEAKRPDVEGLATDGLARSAAGLRPVAPRRRSGQEQAASASTCSPSN